MAVLPSVPYIRVCVNTMGKNAVEYPDPDEDQKGGIQDGALNKMSVYIEAKTGRKFCFEYYVDHRKLEGLEDRCCLGFFATIDGHKTSSTVICNEDGFKPNQWLHLLLGDRLRQPGGMKVRQFQFAKIQIGDDAPLATTPKDVSQLGELVIQVWRVRKVITVETPISQNAQEIVQTKKKFHEVQLKGRAVSHTTEFGKPQTTHDQETFYKLEYIDPVNKPLAEFHFKYRSKEVLQQMMILPQDLKFPQNLPPNLAQASFTARQPPRVPMPPHLVFAANPLEKPFVPGKNAAQPFKSLTAERKAATEIAIPPMSTTGSVITGRSFDQVTGSFLPRSAPPQTFGQIPPKFTTGSMFVPIPKVAQAAQTKPREEFTYPTTPAFGSISQVAPRPSPKASLAFLADTPAKATLKPGVKTPESAGLITSSDTLVTPCTPVVRAALERPVTPFTQVLMEINKNLNHLRDIAKGVNVVELQSKGVDENVWQVRDQLLQVENEIRAEVGAHVKPEQTEPEGTLKRERVVEQDDDLEVVLERPVKRRHIFTEEDEIIDLTAD
ncbi:hypothetical protein NHQ30_008774 [Ciborinia camelliae]|nr:hypothetical protein NHQ30_008774 [Ciborinia camelliae]